MSDHLTPPMAHKVIRPKKYTPANATDIRVAHQAERDRIAKQARPTFQHFDSPEALARHLQYVKDNAAILEF